ncbi:helix-turn-helix transcriptional regulator [Frankia sp. CNm7]|uniref:Helix-turn-helix transcriptional regulator n=1 Tax=Frankia nepalensis TaxID=1836974 RepID=A0A937RRQ1_9ACTN|nr:TetR family transcriptional regulator [Frankia nepalensis]MBL7498992.1 helix-turn-helix transcriptional regulator [Frankia nepalensis]MBL7511488.1 helix-turn-helix transcriptional regulator [Frankia nepalensis]MBL7520704.1 helix-turn-helix transcriptional regulator [Frankia nepalensis]MBL7630731.1 helix-turn-helix transcriptional regulator [Frankia nepalensis]
MSTARSDHLARAGLPRPAVALPNGRYSQVPELEATLSEPGAIRPRYDSPLRRERAAATRARIVASGAEILHGMPIWNWRALTVRAAAERAGVSERTVYRHFATERDLREAVMAKLESESGVNVEDLTLSGIRKKAERRFGYVASFPLQERMERDPTVAAANERQRAALMAALGPETDGWPDEARAMVAAVFDVLGSVVSYERAVMDWNLPADRAIAALSWAIALVEDAVRAGQHPEQ